MMKQQLRFLHGFVASMAVLAFATSARADITWILQPSSTITMTAQFGSTHDNNNVIELYNTVGQTDPGTGVFTNANPYYNFTSGLSSRSIGTFTSVGNSFLTSLNFGAEPAQPTYNNASTIVLTSGNWLPATDGSGTGTPGTYGSPTPQDLAGALVPAAGYAGVDNADGGRVAIFGSYGTIHSAGQAMTVNADGTFNGQPIAIIGGLNVDVNYNGNNAPLALQFPPVTGNADQPANTNPTGEITRGSGATSYQYLINLPLPSVTEKGGTALTATSTI